MIVATKYILYLRAINISRFMTTHMRSLNKSADIFVEH